MTARFLEAIAETPEDFDWLLLVAEPATVLFTRCKE
jgi:hypothetical protein